LVTVSAPCGEAGDLDVVELAHLAVRAGDLGGDQAADHVVLRVLPALLHQAVVVDARVDVRLHVLLGHLELSGLDLQALVDPVPDLLAELLGDAGHPGDHLDRERTGEVLHHVEVVRIDLAEIVLDELDDGLALGLDGPRREGLVEQAAHEPVFGRIHEDDRLLEPLSGLDHRQVAPAGRRERLVVLERRRHVGMAGQGVEVLFLVVVQRGLVAHAAVDVVRIVEIVLRIRVELQFRLGHGMLLRGGLDRPEALRDANSL
jgi:hypothetical protein